MSLNELAVDPGRVGSGDAGEVPAPSNGLSRGLPGRVLATGVLRVAYPAVAAAGTLGLLACGGFVPILRRWLSDEIHLGDWPSIVATLGGVWPTADREHGFADLGPSLGRHEAASLHEEIESLARAFGTTPPGPPRLTFLPCCGLVASGRGARALVIGLPLLQVLTRGELRAVLAHELAHVARGDAARQAWAVRFVERLEEGLDAEPMPGVWRRGPLRAWARWSYRRAASWVAPLARAQEERADRLAAGLVGGDVAASALVKVALMQPLFREVLEMHDARRLPGANLYATFRALWRRLPPETMTAMRHALLADRSEASPTHPRLIERLTIVQSYPARPASDSSMPASTLVAEIEAIEDALHRRLFAADRLQPSVFHRAGT